MMEYLTDTQVEDFLRTGSREAELRKLFGDLLYEDLTQTARTMNQSPMLRETAARTVFILPGIVGSKLSLPRFPFNDLVWVDPDDLILGGVSKLKWSGNDDRVIATGVLLTAYLRMKLRLTVAGFRVEFLPYDWRRAPMDCARRLMQRFKAGEVVGATLIGHSMGGLVARGMASLDPDRSAIARVITIGTPNHGSYSPVQVLRLEHSLVHFLARLDQTRTAEEITSDFLRDFPGLLQMLPSPELRPGEDFFDPKFWPSTGIRPLKEVLERARKARASLPPPDGRFFQIVGTGQETIQRASVKDGVIVYDRSRDGDGTVPRDLAEFANVPRFYFEGVHGWLCNQLPVIDAVADLIKHGATDRLPTGITESIMPEQTVDEAMVRREAEAHAQALLGRPPEVAVLDSFGTGMFDRDPSLVSRRPVPPPLAASEAVRPRSKNIGVPEVSPAFDRERAVAAAQHWRDAKDKRERAATRAADNMFAPAEEEGRISAYVRRVRQGLEALPTFAQRELPPLVRDMLHGAEGPEGGSARQMLNERIIGAANEFLSVLFLKRADRVARSVGRIVTWPQAAGFGTGFLVAPGVLITNKHVLGSPRDAEMSAVQFDYELDMGFREQRGEVFRLEPERLFITSEQLDYALVAVAPRGEDGGAIESHGWLPLVGQVGKIMAGQPVNIIQHPQGRRKEVVFRESTLLPLPDDPDHILHYTGDTEPGSSGSPVFNDFWEVIALHHSAVPELDKDGLWVHQSGPARSAAEADLKDVRWLANEGIRVSRLVRDLQRVAGETEPGTSSARLIESVLEEGRKAAERPFGGGTVAAQGSTEPEMGATAAARLSAQPPPALPPCPAAAGLAGRGGSRTGATAAMPGEGRWITGEAPGRGRLSTVESITGETDDREELPEQDPRHGAVFALTTASGIPGTAFAVGPSLLLSVAHNLDGTAIRLMRHFRGKPPEDVLETLKADYYTVLRTAIEDGGAELIGLRLEAARRFRLMLRPSALGAADLLQREIEVIGYSEHFQNAPRHTAILRHRGTVTDIHDGRIFYSGIDTDSGQSGGPIVLAGTQEVVGIHAFSFTGAEHPTLRNVNAGIHLTPRRLQEISSW
ncbi:trypsin-like peptidase domain-containing protein [Azospirillum picis]|uniref:Serine protease n=1 Tax=Azospirillum picis TaxID=488438 RepID=A0ABU0MSI5_9PROT|nr:trypsin-like peptidase domain-containing protein [Azospirillum picis]MBP2302702.1 V8-like Glu-specific endopeptidase/pimeloyl-ACP methyl ester carboxylesterase [Azospirillum picis]MDQ0536453.1 V8-like Glu-specific endopeptidase/pimeloyl-ACP methyl ester carboxylesterase [Azospirillum picis]